MQNEESKLKLVNYIEKASVAILGILFVLFPLLFTNLTTDIFALPKEALLIFAVSALLILFGVKTLVLEKVRVRKSPFDLPILLFLGALLLSSIFSVAKVDSFANFIPVLFAGLAYFTIIFNVRNQKSLLALFGCLITGGVIASLVSILSYFKLYIFPLDFTKIQSFSTLGTTLDQAIYLFLTLVVGVYVLYPYALKIYKTHKLEENRNTLVTKLGGFGLGSLVVLAGLALSVYELFTTQKPLFLPIDTGFQTAFAAISQDSGRLLQGLLFGNGFGEYFIAFSKFKQASLNSNPTLWSAQFIRSSNFILELLATTGLLGFLSFLFLGFKTLKERPIFVPLLIALAVCIVLPLSFFDLALIFFIFGLFGSVSVLNGHRKYFDVDLQLVALKNGFFAFATEEEPSKPEGYGKILSYFVFIVIIVFTLGLGFLSYDYLYANTTFQKSLVAAGQNNGSATYQYESQALSTFTGKYVDSYYRIFSQTNLALANSLSASVPQGSSPSAQTQQTVVTLVQQSITAAKQATTVSPQNSINWQNLSGIYRTLIGFGQNADQFAVLAQQQAIQLDPTNPQQYITLGGIYYQLGLWDQALTQFQTAANLKPDYPNAYYNIGHALQQKGDLKNALLAYQTVKSLVTNDPTNLAKINSEIAALQAQLGQQAQAQPTTTPATAEEKVNAPLNVASPAAVLPAQKPPVKIPAPKTELTPTPTPTTEGGLPVPTDTPVPNP